MQVTVVKAGVESPAKGVSSGREEMDALFRRPEQASLDVLIEKKQSAVVRQTLCAKSGFVTDVSTEQLARGRDWRTEGDGGIIELTGQQAVISSNFKMRPVVAQTGVDFVSGVQTQVAVRLKFVERCSGSILLNAAPAENQEIKLVAH